jgi:hypothetical protein
MRLSSGRRMVASLGLAASMALAAAGAAQANGLDVVASGLANPRGLDVGPTGALYVAEAGSGGQGPCITGPEGEACLGATGAIARIDPRTGRVRRVVDGLPSLAASSGEDAGADATGPQDVSVGWFGAYFTIGLGGSPAVRDELGAGSRRLGTLYRAGLWGGLRRVADLAAYEAANDPDKGQPSAEVDSNPYSVDASNPLSILVTDAGGNDLLRVRPWGKVQTRAVFPFGDYQPVPTGVVRAPGGGAYVGQLTSFPFPAGAANVFRVRGRGAPSVAASSFTTVVDVANGRRGSLYVLQIASDTLAGPPTPGRLLRVNRDGSRTDLAAGMLHEPTGLAVAGRDIYVANDGGSPTDGQIVHIRDGG